MSTQHFVFLVFLCVFVCVVVFEVLLFCFALDVAYEYPCYREVVLHGLAHSASSLNVTIFGSTADSSKAEFGISDFEVIIYDSDSSYYTDVDNIGFATHGTEVDEIWNDWDDCDGTYWQAASGTCDYSDSAGSYVVDISDTESNCFHGGFSQMNGSNASMTRYFKTYEHKNLTLDMRVYIWYV